MHIACILYKLCCEYVPVISCCSVSLHLIGIEQLSSRGEATALIATIPEPDLAPLHWQLHITLATSLACTHKTIPNHTNCIIRVYIVTTANQLVITTHSSLSKQTNYNNKQYLYLLTAEMSPSSDLGLQLSLLFPSNILNHFKNLPSSACYMYRGEGK